MDIDQTCMGAVFILFQFLNFILILARNYKVAASAEHLRGIAICARTFTSTARPSHNPFASWILPRVRLFRRSLGECGSFLYGQEAARAAVRRRRDCAACAELAVSPFRELTWDVFVRLRMAEQKLSTAP